MDYIEKVFKQHPFIYYINSEYYAFGTGVCEKLDNSSILLKGRFEKYVKHLNEDLSQSEAWKIFREVKCEAQRVKDNIGYKGYEKDSFQKLELNELAIKELVEQIKSYFEFFKKYDLKDYI